MEKILANTVYSDSTLKSWNKENLIELIRILENNRANAENSLNIQAKNCEMFLKEKQEEFNSLKKDYIELDLECRNLRTELDKELAEHEEFTKKANSLIELQKENIEKTHKNNMELREEIESLKSKSSFKNSWKNKFFKAQEEVERLNQGYDMLNYESARKEEYIETLKKQVNELLNRRIEPKIFHCHADALENCPKVEQAVKDKTKEILQGLVEKAYSNGCIDLTVNEVKAWFREDYGVEVE